MSLKTAIFRDMGMFKKWKKKKNSSKSNQYFSPFQ